MEKLHKQISAFRAYEDAVAFLTLMSAASYIAYQIGLMNGRLGF